MYKLSVIICTYNRVELLGKCVNSLMTQTARKENYEIIVIDNNSTDNTSDLIRKIKIINSNLRYVKEANQGLSYARNRGWKEAKGEYIAYIDDDCKADNNWCKRIIEAFEIVKPQPVVVGGSSSPWYNLSPPSWFCDYMESFNWGDDCQFLQPPVAKYGFYGFNMAIKRSVLEKNGGFSTKFLHTPQKLVLGEETEFFCRIFDNNPWFWYDPSIKVLNYVSNDKFLLSNRFKRSYESGKTLRKILNCRVISSFYVKKFGEVLLVLAKIPFRLIFRIKSSFLCELVIIIDEICYYLGFLAFQNPTNLKQKNG